MLKFNSSITFRSERVGRSAFQELSPLMIKNHAVSGKKSYKTKAEATEILQQQGYTVKGSLTRDVTILVNESGIESAKTKSARDKGIQIINNLLDFLEK